MSKGGAAAAVTLVLALGGWLSVVPALARPPTVMNSPGYDARLAESSWIRTDGVGGLAPDWSRIGTDITNQGPFNARFR